MTVLSLALQMIDCSLNAIRTPGIARSCNPSICQFIQSSLSLFLLYMSHLHHSCILGFDLLEQILDSIPHRHEWVCGHGDECGDGLVWRDEALDDRQPGHLSAHNSLQMMHNTNLNSRIPHSDIGVKVAVEDGLPVELNDGRGQTRVVEVHVLQIGQVFLLVLVPCNLIVHSVPERKCLHSSLFLMIFFSSQDRNSSKLRNA